VLLEHAAVKPLGNEFPGLVLCRVPCWQRKMQGISTIQPFFAKIRLQIIRKLSSLQANSLRREQGIISGEQGIDFPQQGIPRPRPNSSIAVNTFFVVDKK
jgi:hypothetical protein